MLRAEERAVLRDMAAALGERGLSFLLVGAGARVLLLEETLGLAAGRSTTDWDIGVQVESWQDFGQVGDCLRRAGFSVTGVEHRFLHPGGMPVDVVPFGALEETNGIIRWPGGDSVMTVLGFAEALATADVLSVDGVRVPVAGLPFQAVLKCFAFDERRESDDLIDLWRLLRYGAEHETERFFRDLAEILASGAVEFEDAGAALLGLDAGKGLLPATLQALLPIVQGLTDPGRPELAWLVTRLGDGEEEWRRRKATARTFTSFGRGLESGAAQRPRL